MFEGIEERVEAELADLEATLGHDFTSPELLIRALTHRSLAQERVARDRASGEHVLLTGNEESPTPGDNERMEFLGDAVLGLVVGEALFLAHPEWHEGELTRVRAQLVSRQHMAEVALAIGLGRFLRLSKGEERGGLRRKSTVLSNTMEAVLGALFLDGGLETVRAFARRYIMGEAADQLARDLQSGAALGNYKSALQEHLQAARAGSPVYRVKSETGPDHRKRFLVEVRLKTSETEPGKTLARGMGSTKKHAEQDAARRAMDRLTAAASKTGAAGSDEVEEQMAE